MKRLYSVLVGIISFVGLALIILGLFWSSPEKAPEEVQRLGSLTDVLIASWKTLLWIFFLLCVLWILASKKMWWVWKAVLGFPLLSLIFIAGRGIAKIFPAEGHGGGITTPSFFGKWMLWTAIIAMVVIVGMFLWKKWSKKDAGGTSSGKNTHSDANKHIRIVNISDKSHLKINGESLARMFSGALAPVAFFVLIVLWAMGKISLHFW